MTKAIVAVVVAASVAGAGGVAFAVTSLLSSKDRSAPTIAFTFPTNNGSFNATAWASGCLPQGVCGTASDQTGVASVSVAVQQQSTGKYWNGSTFGLSTPLYNAATGTTSWGYAMVRPVDGVYIVAVRAVDTLGNATAAGSETKATFTVDTVAPPVPTITSHPDNPTSETTASFTYSDGDSTAAFRCALDAATPSPCASGGVSYSGLTVGDHCFRVRAVDPAANLSSDASFCWTVLVKQSFGITGSAAGLLAPGVTQPIDLTFSNPYDYAIRITSVTVTIGAGSTKAGCDGRANLSMFQQLTATPSVPAHSTRSLSSLKIAQDQWPQVKMLDLPTNQDACKSATFSFTYSGSATKA